MATVHTVRENHSLLSDRAKDCDPDTLDAHVLVAASLLQVVEFFPKTLSDQDILEAALALQVSFQVEQGIEGMWMAEARRGARVNVYRGRAEFRNKHVHRAALEMVRELKRRLAVT